MLGLLLINSDFMETRDFFNSLSGYLQPNNRNNKSPHMCFLLIDLDLIVNLSFLILQSNKG